MRNDTFDLSGLSARHTAAFLRGVRGAADEDDAGRLSEITAILASEDQIGLLSDDEIVGLETELREIADRILDGTAAGIDHNDVGRLTEVAEALDTVRSAASARVEVREAQQAEVDALAARIRADDGDDDEPEAEADDESDDDDAEGEGDDAEAPAEAETDDDDVVEPVLEPVTASAPTLAEIGRRVPRQHAAAPVRTEHPFIRALERGQRVTLDDFAGIMAERWNDFGGTGANEGEHKIRLGRISIVDRIPEERFLHSHDSFSVVDAKMDAVNKPAMRPEAWTPELVASGGFCAPFPADYDLMQISGAQRPVRDSLARFGADRGGVRYTPPPDLSDVLVDQTGGAIGEWTNTTDESPGEATKTCQTVPCGTPTEAETQAIYRCLGFGNFGARAYPEWVQTWTLNAAAAWARKAEGELLNAMSANSVAVTSTGIYGYVSELLTHMIQLAYGERSRQRMPQETRLRVWLPSWVPGQFQIDLLRQGSVVTEVRSVEQIRAMFSAINVNVTFYDDERTSSGQVQGAQGAGVELRDLPEIVEWYLSHEGAFTFLDGGELDLGIVRDSTLNETNDFRIFAENWEGLAYRGIFSYRVRSTLCPNGERSFLLDGDPCGAS